MTALICILSAAGTDVARKMIILGRECGLAVEMQQVHVQSLVPPQLADTQSADDFMERLPQVWQHFTGFPLIQTQILCQTILKSAILEKK